MNEAFDSYVKIGKTSNLEQRIRQLDNTSSPLPFRCVFAVEVADMDKKERLAHSVFADQRVRTNREFFEVDQQRVIAALQLTGGRDVTPRDDIVESIEDTDAIDKVVKKKTRRSNTLFQAELNIGDVLYWHDDQSITCTVTGERTIRYWDGVSYWSGDIMDPDANEDEPWIWDSLSSAALCVLNRDGYKWKSVNGWRYWMYDGETISERLQRILDEKTNQSLKNNYIMPDWITDIKVTYAHPHEIIRDWIDIYIQEADPDDIAVIPLSKGFKAIVDKEYEDLVDQYYWFAAPTKASVYAKSSGAIRTVKPQTQVALHNFIVSQYIKKHFDPTLKHTTFHNKNP